MDKDEAMRYRMRPPKSGPGSTDGFYAAGGRPGNQPGADQPSGVNQIGNFQSTEGFHPRRRQTAPGLDRQFNRQPRRDETGKINLDLPEAPARKKRFNLRGNYRKVAVKAVAVIMVIGLVTGGYLFGKGYLKARQIFAGGGGAAALDENVDPSRLRGEGDGRVNVLLLGKGGAGHEGADLTDTLIVASIDPIHKEASLLSIPRDLYVKSAQGYSRINAVYTNAKTKVLNGKRIENQKQKAETAGLEATTSVVEDHMGIPIHYHVMIDFAGFERAINEVGGIDVDIKEPIYEVMRINGQRYVLNVKKGRQHLDGTEALAYSRSRMVSARGDFSRGERQRLVLVGLKDKIFSTGTFANPKKISGLIDAFGGNMQSNLSTGEVMRLYELGKEINSSKISSIGLADPPNVLVKTANVSGQSVVVPTAGVSDYSEIRSYVRNALEDGFIRSEDAVIAVYNGTTIAGLAGRRANDLKSFGYNISTVADAPTKNYQKTILVDLRKGENKYTKRYLEQRLKTTATGSMPDGSINPGNADFVIILGQNEANNY